MSNKNVMQRAWEIYRHCDDLKFLDHNEKLSEATKMAYQEAKTGKKVVLFEGVAVRDLNNDGEIIYTINCASSKLAEDYCEEHNLNCDTGYELGYYDVYSVTEKGQWRDYDMTDVKTLF